MRRKLNALCKDGSELDNISYYALLKLLIRFKRRNGNRHTDRKHSNLVNICLLFHEAMYHDDIEYRISKRDYEHYKDQPTLKQGTNQRTGI